MNQCIFRPILCQIQTDSRVSTNVEARRLVTLLAEILTIFVSFSEVPRCAGQTDTLVLVSAELSNSFATLASTASSPPCPHSPSNLLCRSGQREQHAANVASAAGELPPHQLGAADRRRPGGGAGAAPALPAQAAGARAQARPQVRAPSTTQLWFAFVT